ncbi:DUF3726 domain-containing protein [Roseovarius sp. CAU 1744]|uniref:DUF3726 domain-containing protein n=1 Tax=Roseovarius sp. CAU 1744 TaxID=3140368 RepID=UPI00325B202D
MSWSLNEVEGLARKAARGAGFSWGLAEEAGIATRWLMAMGLPGATALAGLLTRNDGVTYTSICPVDTDGRWRARGGTLCPLICGAAICDHAARLAEDKRIELGETAFPLLVLPFAAGAAQLTGKQIEITWPGCAATIGPDGKPGLSETTSVETALTAWASIRVTTGGNAGPRRAASRCEIPAAAAKTLAGFAHRTYAPDTPESRLSGAGAGLSDND